MFVVPVKDSRFSWDSLSLAAPSLSYICNCLREKLGRDKESGVNSRMTRSEKRIGRIENGKLDRRRRRRRGDFKKGR